MKKLFFLGMALVVASASAQGEKGYDRANMNLNVKPGDDFAEYATGNWLQQHPIREDQMSNGAFIDLYDQNQKQIQELIQQFTTTPQEVGSIGYKISTLYNQMMDSTGRDLLGLTPIMSDIERVRAIKDRQEFQRVTAEIDRRGGSTMLFAWGVHADQRQSDMNIVSLHQGGLGLGLRDYYFNEDEQTVRVREAYKNKNRKLMQLLGYDEATAHAKVEAIFAIEKQIAQVSYDRVKLRDVNANYHRMSYAELIRDYPGIDWPTVFWLSGFPVFDAVVVGQPEPIKEAGKILTEAPLEDLKAMAELRIIDDATSYLTTETRSIAFEFGSVVNGQTQDDPMWKRATNLVNSILGEPLGKMYCERYFPESSKQRVLNMVHNLQTALAQRIDEATWMSTATKLQAKDKLQNFIIKIGYPDKWKDYSTMQVSDTLSLYENLANINEWFWLDGLNRKVNKPVDKSEWLMTPQTINAYYKPTTNEICFPAGILQAPFFDPETDDAINYGAIGCVIGHEMSHGFDDNGCLFDKNGNQNNWWTAEDKANFDQRGELLAMYFDKIEVVNGKHVNGKQCLGENIGDNGGLNISLRALHNIGCKTVIDGFSADQRFFLGWARVWASNNREQYTEMLLVQDVHSPDRVRVNGALPQIDEWYTAFDVKKGDKLFIPKKNRVKIW